MYTLNILQLCICQLHLKAEKNKKFFKKSVNNRNQSNNMIIKTGRKKRQVANKLINQNCSKTETFNLCGFSSFPKVSGRRSARSIISLEIEVNCFFTSLGSISSSGIKESLLIFKLQSKDIYLNTAAATAKSLQSCPTL